MTELAALGVPVVQSESPPPVRDNDFLARSAATSLPGIEEFGISPPMLRYKIWRLHSMAYADFCTARGITYLRNPSGVSEADGFLKREFWGDFVHGNARYGAAVLAQLKGLA